MKAKQFLYKIIVRKGALATKSEKVVKNVALRQLAPTVYAILSSYPGHTVTISHQAEIKVFEAKKINQNLKRLQKNDVV